MKVLAKHWTEYMNCPECRSYLILGEDDLRYSEQDGVHICCEVCDTKSSVQVPSYILKKLQNALAGIKKHPELD